MPNSFDPNSRGASDSQLSAYGALVMAAITLAAALLMAKSTGQLDNRVRITAELTNVGDGLPARSDVKYRGMLVGTVTGVKPALRGHPNIVEIALRPDAVRGIPANVTARVIPTNVFAISSIELIEHGPGKPLRDGDMVAEDTGLSTVLFQTTIDKLRRILFASGYDRGDNAVGLLDALANATSGRGQKLATSGAELTRLVDQLNSVVAQDTSASAPSTLTALGSAAQNLKSSTPALIDALRHAIVPMRTIAETQDRLTTFLSGGLRTLATARTAFDNHTDQLITISTDISPVVGVFADHREAIPKLTNMVKGLSDQIFKDAWDSERQMFNVKAIVALTPTTLYTREDCPRYGDLQGPSCVTAPVRRAGGVTPDLPPYATPDLPPQLLPNRYIPPPGMAPPPESPTPSTAPASFGGTVGPVGSTQERDQLGIITGAQATSATQLLLGPVMRGNTVELSTAQAHS